MKIKVSKWDKHFSCVRSRVIEWVSRNRPIIAAGLYEDLTNVCPTHYQAFSFKRLRLSSAPPSLRGKVDMGPRTPWTARQFKPFVQSNGMELVSVETWRFMWVSSALFIWKGVLGTMSWTERCGVLPPLRVDSLRKFLCCQNMFHWS